MKIETDRPLEKSTPKPKEQKPRQKPPQGVRVSRQRHGSTTFVVRSSAPAARHAAVTTSHTPATNLRFVHNGVADPVIWTPTADRQLAVSEREDEPTDESHDPSKPSVLRFRTEDSTWCFQPSSADQACAQLGIWNRICHQMRILPLWSAYRVPKHLAEATPGQLRTGLDLAPELFYPLDKAKVLSFNPMREQERYLWIPKSSTVLTTALMMGCLFEDVRSGKASSPAFSALHTAACQALNAMIAAKERTVVLGDHAAMIICEMALSASLRGSHDDWRTHMLGLNALMENWCGWRDLHDVIGCNAIYLADVEGSLAAGQSPILLFQRRFPVFEPQLATETMLSRRQGIETLTLAAELPSATREMLLSISIFTEAVSHAKIAKITYHPHHISEEFWGLNYGLLLQPSSLFPNSQTEVTKANQSLGLMPKPDTLNLSGDYATSLDATVRIAALLFLREPMAEVVFSRRGYPQLLSLLAAHLSILLVWMRDIRGLDEDSEPPNVAWTEGLLKEASNEQERIPLATSISQSARSLLVWSCVVGYLYALRMGVSGLHARVFKDVIFELCGGMIAELTEEDLLMFQLMDMKYVHAKHWDPMTTLRHIMNQQFDP